VNRIFLYIAGFVVVTIAAFAVVNRPQLMVVDAEIAPGYPADGFPHDAFENLLRKYVDSGGKVDYEAWHGNAADRRRLESYLAAAGAYSPESTPERFVERSDALAYWMYSYNAYVIWSILRQWPIASVTDVRAPLEIISGLGFFYRQRFLFGGKPYSLYAVENDKIRAEFKDPRIHFVLNCASESCPVLRPELPDGDELESMLEAATVEFVSDERNVRIDHDSRTIVLSRIFRWFQKDFVNELRRRGLPADNGSLDYVIDVAPDGLKQALKGAIDYAVDYADYDWSLNNQEKS
jgi:hypothetical protein